MLIGNDAERPGRRDLAWEACKALCFRHCRGVSGSPTKWELVAHLKCNNRIRLCCCNISMPCAVAVVVVVAVVIVVVACYFGIYRVLTQSQFQLTLFAFGHCQCRLPATVGRVDSCLQVGRGKERGQEWQPFPFSTCMCVWGNLLLSALWKMHLCVATSCETDEQLHCELSC